MKLASPIIAYALLLSALFGWRACSGSPRIAARPVPALSRTGNSPKATPTPVLARAGAVTESPTPGMGRGLPVTGLRLTF